MIDLKFTGPCERCEHRDLYLEETELHSSDLECGNLVSNEVHCRHEKVCKEWNATQPIPRLTGLELDTLIVPVNDIDSVNRVILEQGQYCRMFHEDGKED